MTAAPSFLHVHHTVASNPVARAIQHQRIMTATRDFRIRLHLLREGELVQADAVASGKVIAVAIGVLALQGRTDAPAWRVMHGGLSALLQLCERRFKWRVLDSTAVDMALEHAAETIAAAPAALVHRAWLDSEREHALHRAAETAR